MLRVYNEIWHCSRVLQGADMCIRFAVSFLSPCLRLIFAFGVWEKDSTSLLRVPVGVHSCAVRCYKLQTFHHLYSGVDCHHASFSGMCSKHPTVSAILSVCTRILSKDHHFNQLCGVQPGPSFCGKLTKASAKLWLLLRYGHHLLYTCNLLPSSMPSAYKPLAPYQPSPQT